MRITWLVSVLAVLAFNTAIAGLLVVVNYGPGFVHNFIFSQCIGLSIFGINGSLAWRFRGRSRWPLLALSFPLSILLGVSLGSWLTGNPGWSDPRAWEAALLGLFFGGIAGITSYLFERIERLDSELRLRQLRQSQAERRELEAQLKLLQAQIEPHFLFNTLANVGSLIETSPEQARQLLDRLNDWLRVALARARSDRTTLGDELSLLQNYLEILAVRFGDRLRWIIQADRASRLASFPPMLLQPLVENAVRHGIEPKVGGGEIIIRASLDQNRLHVEVADDGVGLQDELIAGAGLDNVRSRLAALYGESAHLTLESKEGDGVVARLELPASVAKRPGRADQTLSEIEF